MSRSTLIVSLLMISACTHQPVPAQDPAKAWVELFTRTGKLVMAEQLDGVRLSDGRYFQLAPGGHDLMVRFDYDVTQPLLPMGQPIERICYITLRYQSFQAGQRYRLEARSLGLSTLAMLYDPQGVKVATARDVNCLF